MSLRDYQENSIAEIKTLYRQNTRKVLLWLATGAGKTVIFSRMVKDCDARGKRAIVVVRGRKLVDQASQRLFREHVAHGVMMASHWNNRPHLPVQVCSVDTLISRQLRPPADLIILDEADLATSEGYRTFLSDYPQAFVASFTATPYVSGGLRHVADAIVHPISMMGLIEQGYLCGFRYFAPSEPDLTNVQVSASTKDYVVDQLEGAMIAGQLTGRIVDHWKKIAENRPTLCFAVNVRHSKILCEKFLEAGIMAEHCDANTPDDERNAIQKRVENGETKIVCNVGILGRGVDIPCVSALIMARPTKSKNLFIQQAGRGTRLFDGKPNCILLDHAGNIGRHGLPTDEPDVDLDGRERKQTVSETKICKNCFAAYRGKVCPECGVVPPEMPRPIIEETDAELTEIHEEFDPIKKELKRLLRERKNTNRKMGWVYHRLVDKFSYEEVKHLLPMWFIGQRTINERDPFFGSPFTYKVIK